MTHATPSRLTRSSVVFALIAVAVLAFWLGRTTAARQQVNAGSAAQLAQEGAEKIPGDVRRSSSEEGPPADASLSIRTWSESEWEGLTTLPASLARSKNAAELLAALARVDAPRALQLAQAEKNLLLREDLVHAALSGWAAVSPEDAIKWVATIDDSPKRGAAMQAVLTSAATNLPEESVALGRELFQRDAGAATGYGCALVDALCAAGHFQTAVELATGPSALDTTGQSILLAKTYSAWATMQPEQAAQAAIAIADQAARSEALHAVVGGWGQVDPAGLTQFVAQLPSGPRRIPLMGDALRAWSQIDPAAATNWVRTNDVGPGLDDGVAAMAGAGFLEPKEAARWTTDIASPALRSQTLLTVLRNWANTDPDAASQYFEMSPDLQPAERAQAAALFAPPGGAP